MDPTDWTMFVAALVVVYLMPGADMLLVLQTGAAEGRSRALATAGGLALARAAHVCLAGVGLAALFRAQPLAFDLARWAGAAFLVWLGWGILRSDGPDPIVGAGRPGVRRSHGAAVLRGLLTNILNPKALLFCSMLLPQFVHPDRGPVETQFLALGAALVAIGFAFDAVFARLGAGLGALLARRPRLVALRRGVFATLLIGLGMRLAFGPRPS